MSAGGRVLERRAPSPSSGPTIKYEGTGLPGMGTAAGKTDGSGLDRNLAGALSYLLGLVTGIVFFVIDEDDSFVRFHAAQSIVASLALFVISIVLSILSSLLVGLLVLGGLAGGGVGGAAVVATLFTLLWTGFSLVVLVLWLFLMYKAYQGDRYRLPVIGSLAENIAS